jgi:guanyl-specific ribonuclease Sa
MRTRSPLLWLVLAFLLVAGARQWLPGATDAPARTTSQSPAILGAGESAAPTDTGNSALPAFLPAEARTTVARIRRGGPFPYRQDGQVFGNREGLLPRQPHGWYREYTVDTPDARDRGARRIVTGGTPPRDWYYSDDHYRSFRAFTVPESPP